MDQSSLEISKIDDEDDVNPPPFSLLYFDLRYMFRNTCFR